MQSTLPQPGATVWIRGQRWRVSRVRFDRLVARLEVVGAGGRRAFLHPFDRATESPDNQRPVRARIQRANARFAWLAGRSFSRRTLLSATYARAAILPHQLEPALAAISGARRILIADEVGLGKTIQAGLIAAEILRRDPSGRVLVIVPAALIAQWTDELRGRFDLACVTADHDSFARRILDRAFDDNPWNGAGIFLTSLDFLKQPHVLDGLPPRAWDLVVVDEAHTACGISDRHRAVNHVGRRARCLVLLTATPHSGDQDRFARLLSLGWLGELPADPPIVFHRRRSDVGLTSRRRTAWHHVSLSQAEVRVLKALGGFERVVLRAARGDHRDEARLLLAVLRKRALSTMSALLVSIERRLAWLSNAAFGELRDGWMQTRLDFGSEDAEDVADADSVAGLRARSGLDHDTEQSWLKRLAHLADTARAYESKVRRVARLIARAREPVVVFTEFRDSLSTLVERVRLLRPIAILHGGMTARERSESIARFQRGEASVLVATDVAGQGLNLHHRCRWVISLELPWNPARLEQRIGRVDRIGQARPVHFTLLVARHDTEAGLLARLARRVAVANRTLHGASLIEVPASEDAVRTAVIDGTPLDRATEVSVPMAGARWSRLARHAAPQLERRRRLTQQWQGPDLATRPTYTWRSGASRLLYSVPFFDRSGGLVETHLVALSAAGSLSPALVGEAGCRAAAVLLPRLRRVRRLATCSLEDKVQVERALTAAMRPAVGDTQPGLFDAAALRARDVTQANTDDLEQHFEATVERLRLAADIDMGRPVLEVAWLPRP
jgi:superfamily II DNA or RNA helicase